jgi:hypothetical protein
VNVSRITKRLIKAFEQFYILLFLYFMREKEEKKKLKDKNTQLTATFKKEKAIYTTASIDVTIN